ncbi:MAG TPA: SDR family NAD(P)-dependent oxidoreductase, partial [Pseudomonadales bacterium]
MPIPSEWIDLSGKTAHVTGAARGIGAAIARALAMAGASVMVSDSNGDGAQELAREIGAAAMTLDVTDPDAVEDAMRTTAQRLGGLHILVNNAGIYQGYGGPVREI